MAEPAYVKKLTDALHATIPGASVETEARRPTRYEFVVIADKYEHMEHADRQREVWHLAEKVLEPDEILEIWMILTISPFEAAGSPDLVVQQNVA